MIVIIIQITLYPTYKTVVWGRVEFRFGSSAGSTLDIRGTATAETLPPPQRGATTTTEAGHPALIGAAEPSGKGSRHPAMLEDYREINVTKITLIESY